MWTWTNPTYGRNGAAALLRARRSVQGGLEEIGPEPHMCADAGAMGLRRHRLEDDRGPRPVRFGLLVDVQGLSEAR